MGLPDQVFFRQHDGSAIGPFALTALEVLYYERVVDERTPVSGDGHGFRALGEWAEVLTHVMNVKETLVRGEDPWPETLPRVAPVVPGDRSSTNLIGALVSHAGAGTTGTLSLASDTGDVIISVKDGKVVALSTTVAELALTEHLLRKQLVDESALARAEANSASVGGDLGAALVAMGFVEPHVYFQAFVDWAKQVLGHAAANDFDPPQFEAGAVANPSVPLGFDRLGLPVEVVRDAFSVSEIRRRLAAVRRCPLIPSQVEGVQLEDCKLQAKELRALNSVNGVRTLKELLEELGGGEDKDQSVLRAVFFAEQAGFVVFGEDDAGRRERAEAATLETRLERLTAQNDFEILGIDQKNSDEEVIAKYRELAMLYHPDRISPDADPALVDVRRRLFTLVTETFHRQEHENDRWKYASDLEQGNVVRDDPQQVQELLQAELAYEKAKVLVNKRKYDEALQHIDEAIRLNGNDVEIKIQREYIAFQREARIGDGEAAALGAIKRVLALMSANANIASGYMVLGHLHKAVHKQEVALKYFEKVLEYDEDNPIALQEVRIGNRRKDREAKKKKRWL